jgi:hypothetical protein
MHLNTRISFACVAAFATLFHSHSALGGYNGISVVFHTSFTSASGEKHVYRMYANFTDGADRVSAWGGSPQLGTTTLQSGPCNFVAGSSFFQFPGSNTAPSQEIITKIPEREWDTFATIGVSIAEQGDPFDQTLLTTGFPAFINGNQITLTDKFVFIPNNAPQARADYAGDGDLLLRVMLMQLTVDAGEYPFGNVALQWKNAAGQTFTVSNGWWVGLAEFGRCCTPSGQCVMTYHSDCAQLINGFFLGCQPCDACEGTCVPDIVPAPGDGNVDVDDLLAVINAWGACLPVSLCSADVSPAPSGNNVVDVDDLIAVINAWGPCE